METKLRPRDYLLFLVCAVLFAAGTAFTIAFRNEISPEASVEFKVRREGARDRAAAFLAARGITLGGYRHAGVFTYDNTAKTFLERELGTRETTRLLKNEVRLWRWGNRWVREKQKEEFRVAVTTRGEIAGFAHIMEEDARGERLPAPEARGRAEKFLSEVMGRKLEALEFLEANSVERKNRVDHTCTWKLKGFDARGAEYRLAVTVKGGRIGAYAEWLKVPEKWVRDYQKLRSRNNTAGTATGLLFFALGVAMIVSLVLAVRRRNVRWKTGLTYGGIAFALTLLFMLNALPVQEYSYSTTDTMTGFYTGQVLSCLLSGLGAGAFIFLLTVAAEPVYRAAFPGQISVSRQFLWRGLRSKRFVTGTVIGLTMVPLFASYQAIFYLVARHLGAWSPAQVLYSDLLNTHFPWIAVLLVGFMPAVFEEFAFRAYAIPFLQKLLRRRWPAVIIAAFVWGFGHANYPQQPWYVRGLEVGIAGVIVGLIMIRWGLLPCLVWHFTVDAFYTAVLFLSSGNTYYAVSASVCAGIMALPLLVALVLYLRKGSFVEPEPLLNSSEPPPTEPPAAPAVAHSPPDYVPIRGRRLVLLGAVCLAALCAFIPEHRSARDSVDFRTTSSEAETIARSHLESRGIDLKGFDCAVFLRNASSAADTKYLRENGGDEAILRMYPVHLCPAFWKARFYRPLEKEEYRVNIDPRNGSVYSFAHLLPEDAPGKDLPEEQARARAETFLHGKGLDPAAMLLKESSSRKHKSRRDHTFIWEARPGDARNCADARYRVSVSVLGDEPTGPNRSLKLPENWVRARSETRVHSWVLQGLMALAALAAGIHLLVLLIIHIRRKGLPWRSLLLIAASGGTLMLIVWVNNLPTFWAAYPTQIPPHLFLVGQVVSAAIAVTAVGIGAAMVTAAVVSVWPRCLEKLRAPWRAATWRDAVAVALAWVALRICSGRAEELIQALMPEHSPAAAIPIPTNVGALVPAIATLAAALMAGMFGAAMLGIGVYYANRVLKRPWLVALALLALTAVGAAASAQTVPEFGLHAATSLLDISMLVFLLVFFVRDNVLAYFLLPVASGLASPMIGLLRQSGRSYRIQGLALLAACAVLLLILWLTSRRKRTQQSQ